MDYQLFTSIEKVTIKSEYEVKQDIYDLWQECFGDSDKYTDFYFDWKITWNQVFLIYYGRELAAMLHLNPYVLMARGEELPVNYIVGVATKKSHRRKGLMSKLLSASMEEMYNKKEPFTYLMPAKESIYLPFDFRIVYEQDFWNDKLIQARSKEGIDSKESLKVASLDKESHSVAGKSISDIKVIALDEKDMGKTNELVTFSNDFLTGKYDVFVKRTPYYYKRLINEMKSSSGDVLLCYNKDRLIGCLSYMAEQAVYITELIVDKEKEADVLIQVWNYLASVTDLGIYRRKQGSQVPAIMTRIVNLKAFVRRLTAKTPISLNIRIMDPIIKANTGNFLLTINKMGGSIEETTNEPDLVVDIADLSKMFFGQLEEKELDKLLLESSKDLGLDKISYYKNLFINDVV